MDVGTIIAIAVIAVLAAFVLMLVARRKRAEGHARRREEAHAHREEARLRDARADRAAAEAEERAARARREQAIAEEQATAAQRERRFAKEKHAAANELDPDHDGDDNDDSDDARRHSRDRDPVADREARTQPHATTARDLGPDRR
jgi:hypothetical protein